MGNELMQLGVGTMSVLRASLLPEHSPQKGPNSTFREAVSAKNAAVRFDLWRIGGITAIFHSPEKFKSFVSGGA